MAPPRSLTNRILPAPSIAVKQEAAAGTPRLRISQTGAEADHVECSRFATSLSPVPNPPAASVTASVTFHGTWTMR